MGVRAGGRNGGRIARLARVVKLSESAAQNYPPSIEGGPRRGRSGQGRSARTRTQLVSGDRAPYSERCSAAAVGPRLSVALVMCYNARMDHHPLNDRDKQVLHGWAVERYQRLVDARQPDDRDTSYDEWLENIHPYVAARLYHECFSRVSDSQVSGEGEQQYCWNKVVRFCDHLFRIVGSDDYLVVPIQDLIELFLSWKYGSGPSAYRDQVELVIKSRSIRWRVRT
jgi:hypothetical protein